MGRPNYTNRKIEGLKLARAVAKDFIKRIPPNLHAKAALRDPIVELDVTGKNLGSDGFREIAAALVESIKYEGEHGRVVRLEELCLKNNRLDAKSLIDLGLVIRLAAHDLRDLDLSSNSISVITDEDTAAMEYFLQSFAECYVLRRVDFSGNPLGTRAYEILTKVYGNEEPHLFTAIGYPPSNLHYPGPDQKSTTVTGSGLERKLENLHIATNADAASFYATARGLRSIAYLIFSDTAMTECCGLHLSYIIQQHLPPKQLLKRVPPAKAGPPAQHLSAYDLDQRCQGLVYFPNTTLGTTGTKVLELAERARRNLLEELDLDSPESQPEEGIHSATALGSELDRARSRIQGNTLRDFGARSNDLWYAALRTLCLGRTICQRNVAKLPALLPDENKRPTQDGFATNGSALHSPHEPTPLTSRSPNQPQTLRLSQEYRNGKLVLTPIAPSPPTPHPLYLLNPSTPTTPLTLKSLPPSPQNPYRTRLAGGFTEDIWRRVAAYVTGADGIMSEGQQLMALRWAMDRRTLAQEKESLVSLSISVFLLFLIPDMVKKQAGPPIVGIPAAILNDQVRAPETFTDGLPLPKVLVFDLDYTLWPFWVDTHVTPPLKAKDNGTKSIDRWGESFAFYPDVPSILLSAKALPQGPLLLGTASRTQAPDLAHTLLKQLHLPSLSVPPSTIRNGASSSTSSLTVNGAASPVSRSPTKPTFSSSSYSSAPMPFTSPKRALDVFDYMQIFPGDKRRHFEKIQKQSGVEYGDMLFFDDEQRNRNVEQLGVTMWLVRDGVTRSEVDNGVREWRKRKGVEA